jgi:hypothetical protein
MRRLDARVTAAFSDEDQRVVSLRCTVTLLG